MPRPVRSGVMVACKDAKQSRWLGHGGNPARARKDRPPRARYPCRSPTRRNAREPALNTADEGRVRRAAARTLARASRARRAPCMGVMHEVERGLLGIDLVCNLVALCRAVRVIVSRAEDVRAARTPAAAAATA
jgi:hypothetical protein